MTSTPNPEHGRAFDAWFDRFVDDYLQQRPVDATFLGAHRYDGLLPDHSRERDAGRVASARQQIAALDTIPFEGLTETQIFDRALARSALELQIWETGSRFFQAGNPAHHTSAAVLSIVALFRCERESPDHRAEAAIQRMHELPAFLATARDRVSRAPLVWTERAILQADAGLGYFRDGIRMLAADHGIDHPEFIRQADNVALAFEGHAAWLRSVLYEQRIPFRSAGTAAFDRYLHQGHFLPAGQSTEWWFDYAHAELVETTRELRELAAAIDWKRPARQQLAELAGEHPAVDAYYGAFGTAWRTRRQQAIDADLVSWPDTDVQFSPIPCSDRQIASALPYPLYRCLLPSSDRGTVEMLVPPCDPDMPPAERIAVLRRINGVRIDLDFAIREAGLGRHVQCAHAGRSSSRIGRIAGIEGASRPVMFCGGTLVDGWATYATELMEEIGVLTGRQRLAEAQHRVRIAARAVADTAIHSDEFTLERAARFLRDEANLPASVALQETLRLSMFPGTGMQALAGVAAIDELRRQIEEREGARFTLRSFHDRLLSYGAIPMTLIAASMLESGNARGENVTARRW